MPEHLNWLDLEGDELDAMIENHFYDYVKDFFGLDQDELGPFNFQSLFDQSMDLESIKFMAINERYLFDQPCKAMPDRAFLLLPYYTNTRHDSRQKRSAVVPDPSSVPSNPCHNGFSLDESTGYCYKIEAFGQSPYEGNMFCGGKYSGAHSLQFNNDLEVQGFIEWATKSGSLSGTSSLEFYISAWRNRDGQFAMNGKYFAIKNQLNNQTFKIQREEQQGDIKST